MNKSLVYSLLYDNFIHKIMQNYQNGHYQKVCQSKNKKTISASFQSVGTVSDDYKNSLAILTNTVCCLKLTVVTGFLKDGKLNCLLDSVASENFINKNVVNELRLKIFGEKLMLLWPLKHSQSKCLVK